MHKVITVKNIPQEDR